MEDIFCLDYTDVYFIFYLLFIFSVLIFCCCCIVLSIHQLKRNKVMVCNKIILNNKGKNTVTFGIFSKILCDICSITFTH